MAVVVDSRVVCRRNGTEGSRAEAGQLGYRFGTSRVPTREHKASVVAVG